MASIDIQSLAQPVDAEAPAGEDLEYDPLFTEMEQASTGKPEQQMGDSVIEAEEPDWRLVQQNASELLQRTKDLRVCVYLCQAALHNEGIEGFSEALQLTGQLTAEFWGSIHPQLDPDDDDDPTARVNAVMALTTGPLIHAVQRAPLVSVPMLGAVCWDDIKQAAGEEEGKQASSEALAIIENCEFEQIETRRSEVAAALEACQTLETFITQQVGASQAPNLQPLRDLLRQIDKQLESWWQQRGGGRAEEPDPSADGEPSSLDPTEAVPETAAAGGGSAVTSGGSGPPGVITSRQEAIAALDRILDYYQQHEPSSPLPLLLMRAKRLATKSFIEILQDLIPEGLNRAHEIGGLLAESDGGVSSPQSVAGPSQSSAAASGTASASETSELTSDDDDFFS